MTKVDEVNNFLYDVFCKSGMIFDPAEDLGKLRNKDGSLLFTKEESDFLNNKMTECFIYCVYNDLDIYEIVDTVRLEILERRAVA